MEPKEQPVGQALFESPEWLAWERENQINPKYNTEYIRKNGKIGAAHFSAFLRFAAKQHYFYLILQFRDLLRCDDEELQQIIRNTI